MRDVCSGEANEDVANNLKGNDEYKLKAKDKEPVYQDEWDSQDCCSSKDLKQLK